MGPHDLYHLIPRMVPLAWGLQSMESQVEPLPGLKIGEVARRTGLPVKTIRFYSDEGLIHPRGRSEGGYRLFGEEVLAELNLIRTLKAMEIPLQDVARILDSRRSGVCTCSALQAMLRGKAAEISERITDLRDLHAELQGLLSHWETCGGRKSAAAA